METTKQEPIKVETGQRWRYQRGAEPADCVVTERRNLNDGWNVHFPIGGYRPFGDDYWFTDSQFREDLKFLGYAPGYGPQPPMFDPNKVCGAHGQPQFVLGMVLPCASPGCGNGPKGECYDMPLPADDCYVRLRFTRFAKEIAEGQVLWRWKAEPCLDELGIGSLAAKLRLDGWESAIVKRAAVVVEKKVKKGEMTLAMTARQHGKSLAQAQANAAAQMQALQVGKLSGYAIDEMVKYQEAQGAFLGIDRSVATALAPTWYDAGPASIQQAIQEAHDRIVAQLGGTPAKMSVIPPKPKKSQRREVSTDGRHWIDYDRLADGDAFEVYRWRKLDGVLVASVVAEDPRKRIVGYYADEAKEMVAGRRPRTVYSARPGSFFRRQPWKPSVDETDLLADVG